MSEVWDERSRISGTRQELPWDLIEKDVLHVIEDYAPGKKYVNAKHLIDYIEDAEKEYVYLSGAGRSAAKLRISTVLGGRLGWKRFTTVGSRASIYVDPRVGE